MVERYRIFAFTTFYRADSVPRPYMRQGRRRGEAMPRPESFMPTRWFDGPTDGAGTSGLDARCRGAACGVRRSPVSGGPAAGEAWSLRGRNSRLQIRSHLHHLPLLFVEYDRIFASKEGQMVERYRIFAFTTFYRADSVPRPYMRQGRRRGEAMPRPESIMPTRWFDGPTDGAGTSGLDARCRSAACCVRKSAGVGMIGGGRGVESAR